MRILLTNDDGFHAEGLAALERIALNLSKDVWIVAPENDQSGYAHSLSLSDPLRLRQVAPQRFVLRGTPTDCIIMGVRKILPEPPDLILSGINSGCNIADDVTYSGTIAGAMEGAMLGIRSVALSQENRKEGKNTVFPYETCEALAGNLLEKIISMKLPEDVFLNINYPSCLPHEVSGIKVTEQGRLSRSVWVEERFDGRNLPYFWLRFPEENSDVVDGTDVDALHNRFVSVTPLHLNLTAHAFMESLRKTLI